MAKNKILIIEDEDDIRELIKYNLEKEGNFIVEGVDSGEKGLTRIEKSPPDLVLLDLMLPGIDGLNVCRKLKNNDATNKIPIIMLTAKGEETDIVVGLEMGADDYLPKPFSSKVLIARIRSILRRSKNEKEDNHKVIKRKDLEINLTRREVKCQSKYLELTFSEFEILYMLARRPGWVYTRNQIVNEVKGSDYPVTERAIDVQIVGLRRKLAEAGKCIQTIRGVGYRFSDEVN